MKTSHIVVLVVSFFAVALWFGPHAAGFPDGRVVSMATMPDPGTVHWMAALEFTATALGIMIAAISAITILGEALRGARLPQMLPAVVALFGGLLLYQRHWSVAVSFAAIVLGWGVAEYLRPSNKKDDDDHAA